MYLTPRLMRPPAAAIRQQHGCIYSQWWAYLRVHGESTHHHHTPCKLTTTRQPVDCIAFRDSGQHSQLHQRLDGLNRWRSTESIVCRGSGVPVLLSGRSSGAHARIYAEILHWMGTIRDRRSRKSLREFRGVVPTAGFAGDETRRSFRPAESIPGEIRTSTGLFTSKQVNK
jgi:hypothetical protein